MDAKELQERRLVAADLLEVHGLPDIAEQLRNPPRIAVGDKFQLFCKYTGCIGEFAATDVHLVSERPYDFSDLVEYTAEITARHVR